MIETDTFGISHLASSFFTSHLDTRQSQKCVTSPTTTKLFGNPLGVGEFVESARERARFAFVFPQPYVPISGSVGESRGSQITFKKKCKSGIVPVRHNCLCQKSREQEKTWGRHPYLKKPREQHLIIYLLIHADNDVFTQYRARQG